MEIHHGKFFDFETWIKRFVRTAAAGFVDRLLDGL
jgi:hypothetical protein